MTEAVITVRKSRVLIAGIFMLCLLVPGRNAGDARAACTEKYGTLHNTADTDTLRQDFTIYFVCGRAALDIAHKDNALTLDSLMALLGDERTNADRITVTGYASPEGNVNTNIALALRRGGALAEYIVGATPDGIADTVTVSHYYSGWEGIVEEISGDAGFPSREGVLAIINSQRDKAAKDYLIRRLDGGVPFSYIKQRFLPRYCVAVCTVYYTIKPMPAAEPEPEPEDIVEVLPPEPEPEPEPVRAIPVHAIPVEAPAETWKPAMLVKSNALMLAATVFNTGVEFAITPKLSIDIPFCYSPYTVSERSYRLRTLGTQPELRYWFGRSLQRGHFAGLHAHVMGFNVAMGGERYQDPEWAIWGVGLSYGYFLPFGKTERWSVEFTVGAGYANIDYDVYESTGNGYYLRSGHKDYFGITRAGISFGYKFGLKRERD